MAVDLPLLERLRLTIRERNLVRAGARVLVAVSGGPDSLALLHALTVLQNELQIHLVAGHLNHRMRPDECEPDAEFIRETAEAWGIPAEVSARDVSDFARRVGLSLEEAGRVARYRFFARAARRHDCDTVATAHTADDQAETILLHLLRGTGLDGLAGIPIRRPLHHGRHAPVVVRPLLAVSRAEVVAYCQASGLQPRADATNDCMAFLRNRARHQLLPLLEKEYAPAVRRHLIRLALLAEEETALLNSQARTLLEAAGRDDRAGPVDGWSTGQAISLSREVLDRAPPALTRRALRICLQELMLGPPPEWNTVERLLALLEGKAPGFPLPGGRIVARLTDQALLFQVPTVRAPFLEVEASPLTVPGVTPLPWTRGFITARLLEGSEAASEALAAARPPRPGDRALIDLHRVSGSLRVRPPRPGDRIQPFGMQGRRKLQDLLTDRKVPAAVRRQLPIVCDDEKILWVAGQCLSESVKLTPATRSALCLDWIQEPGGDPAPA